MRKQTIIAIVGETCPRFVAVNTCLTVECKGGRVEFSRSDDALPLVVECGGHATSRLPTTLSAKRHTTTLTRRPQP